MRLLIASIVAAALSSSLARADGVKLPPGTIITTPGERGTVTTMLIEARFLIEREDLDYYNALQLRYDALVTSSADCEAQVTRLRVREEADRSFWDGPWGRGFIIG